MGFTPEEPQGLTQTGSWTIVSGTGTFEGLRGSGEMEIAYDPDDEALATRDAHRDGHALAGMERTCLNLPRMPSRCG